MDDFPTKIADLLESTARKIRAMTVDRVRGVAKWLALGIVLATLAMLLAIFLLVGVFRLLTELVGSDRTAYAALGGLFVVAGAFLWGRRTKKSPQEAPEND